MKYILVPDPVPTVIKGEKPGDPDRPGEPLTFAAFIRQVLNDKAFQMSYQTLKVAAAIDRAADGVDGVVTLESQHWQALEKAAKEPTGGYALPAPVMLLMLSFVDAIVGATEKDPRTDGGVPEKAPAL